MSEFWEVLQEHFPEFSSGLWVTTRLVLGAFVIAMTLGTLVAALRTAPVRWLNWLGGIYVEVFRNVPLLVLLYIAFSGFPRAGVSIGEWAAGISCLGLYTSAYIAEALRSGVFAVGKGQIDAALSLGLTYPRTMRLIILPQAARTVIPTLGSLVLAMIKNSAIVGGSLVALPDLLQRSKRIASDTGDFNEVFFWAVVGFLVLTLSTTVLFRYLERRFEIRR